MKSEDKSEQSQSWPEAGQFKKSIRLEISLFIAAIILVLMGATGTIVTNQYVDTISKEIAERLLVQGRSYAGSSGKLIISINGPDALLLINLCKKLASDNSDIYWVGIADRNDNFLAHTEIKKVVSGELLEHIQSGDGNIALKENEKYRIVSDTIRIEIPILENNVIVGWMGIASSARQIIEARNNSIVTVASITLFMILIGIPLSMLLLNRKLKPIRLITDCLKGIDLDDIKLEIPVKSRNEFGYLSETLRVMGIKLNAAQRDLIEKERITRELEIAREIQANILPKGFPQSSSFDCYGSYQSAREVGGDYYDFIDFGNEYLMYLVADVSGKSLPGMLVMLLTRDIVRQQTRSVRQPDELLADVNRELLKSIKKGMFVTMFLGLLNKNTGEFSFASAGHNPLIKVDGNTGKSELIKTNGFPLGMVPEGPFNERIEKGQIKLNANDWLIQYTDGINEAHDMNSEEFGMDRFVEAVEKYANRDTETFVGEFLKRHGAFVRDAEQFDDITLLALKWLGYDDNNSRIFPSEKADAV